MYCVIPIFKEPFLHPLHENNGLSALWCQPEASVEHHDNPMIYRSKVAWVNQGKAAVLLRQR